MEILPFYLKPISRRKRVAPEMAAFNVVICHVEPESRSWIKVGGCICLLVCKMKEDTVVL